MLKKLFEEFDEEIIKLFVQKNSDYYISKWKLMTAKNSMISWNWASFFFTGLWFGYRKMIFYGFLYVLISVLFSLPVIGFFLWLSAWIGVGMFGNYLYGKYTYEKLKELKFLYPNEADFKTAVIEKGGTSIIDVILIMILSFFIYAVMIKISLMFIGVPEWDYGGGVWG
jgi:hypothetical protein